MSMRAMTAVWDYSRTRGPARLVLLAIADGVNDDTNEYHGAVKTIGRKAGYTERFTRKVISKLIPTGELVVIDRSGRTSLYYLPILEGEPGYAPTECQEQHQCAGRHTPLSVSRETAHTARQEAPESPRNYRTGVRKSASDPGTIGPPPRNYRTGDPGTIGPGTPEQGAPQTHIEPIYNPEGTQGPPQSLFDWKAVRTWAASPTGRSRLAAHRVDPAKSSLVLREWREWREEVGHAIG